MTTHTAGLLYGASSYLFWGIAPIYFYFLKGLPATEILAHRVFWSALFLGAILRYQKRLIPALKALVSDRKKRLLLVCSSAMICINWLVFIYAISTGRTVEASLGYFINPLLVILFGVLFFKERLTRIQIISLSFACLGIVYQIWQLGSISWIALTLASSFGLYGLIRKKVEVGSVEGLMIETLLMSPVALLYMAYLIANHEFSYTQSGPFILILLSLAGVVTATPLLLFASGIRRLPLNMMGFLQYLAPTGQFLLGVFAFKENFSQDKLISFSLVWIGLAVLIYGQLRAKLSPNQ